MISAVLMGLRPQPGQQETCVPSGCGSSSLHVVQHASQAMQTVAPQASVHVLHGLTPRSGLDGSKVRNPPARIIHSRSKPGTQRPVPAWLWGLAHRIGQPQMSALGTADVLLPFVP